MSGSPLTSSGMVSSGTTGIAQSYETISPNEKWLGLYLKQIERRSESTRKTYESELRRFLSFINKPLDTVTLEDLNRYADSISHQAETTQHRKLSCIRGFFNWLSIDGVNVLKVNVSAAMKMPKLENVTDLGFERVLLRHEIEKLLDVARYNSFRNYVILSILLSTGVRVSEFCKLRWNDIFEDNDGNYGFRIRGKGHRARVVKILPDVRKRLMELRGRLGLPATLDPDDNTPVIPSSKGGHLSPRQVQRIVHNYAVKAGIKKQTGTPTPHWMRHTFATLAHEGGADQEELRRDLGHSSLQYIPRYAHNVRGLKKTAADKLDLSF